MLNLIVLTVFHELLLPQPKPRSCAYAANQGLHGKCLLNHISSHFLIPLSDSSLICTVPVQ